ncbi:hypothetical protein D9611_014218 [Ephemerocybe angulata]|uniref:HAT C-terminal dimerisation domain-containing protein n=1 Tax=Ephemerocybe angulata TaxID=980116 RepID=A0A8H5B8T1_9AGAR|nr:hypothetical protein D9611_014218 [Tulosesus angulatus]
MATPSDTSLGKRVRRASFRLGDADNDANVELPSLQAAREESLLQQAAALAAKASSLPTSTTPRSRPPSPTSTRLGSVTLEEVEDEDTDGGSATDASTATTASRRKKRKTSKRKKGSATPATTSGPVGTAASAAAVPATTQPTAAQPTPQSTTALHESDSESEPDAVVAPKRNRTEDLDTFFNTAQARGPTTKKSRRCKLCPGEKYLTAEVTTLRRYLEAHHVRPYDKWCERTGFTTMLPKAVRARKDAASNAAANAQQTLNGHLVPIQPAPNVVKYSDALFQQAAEEWLIMTNQPIDALSHPKFHELIEVAARATDGVKIPERRAVRENIIRRFQQNVAELRKRFNSDKVRGEISLTCDAWQAGNRDAYLAVTAHWIEEVTPTDWRLRSALVGFTQMNTAHDGARLGRAMYNVAKRYGITHKIGWITCDNASNNNTMLKWFGTKLNQNKHRRNAKVPKWKHSERHIRCLAHIINLATQAVIATHSKTPHLNTESSPTDVDTALDDLADISTAYDRDETGLIRIITVKARSSAKRTELLKQLQEKEGVKVPLNLILDMKVRWSSTFAMLKRALDLREYLTDFIFKISMEEPSPEKQRALRELCVTPAEWDQVKEFLRILKYADDAQHSFSTETDPALSHALPALEKLHKTWSAIAKKQKYERYHDAVNAGLNKISTYYNKASSVDAYSVFLDPNLKTLHFKKAWANDLELPARDLMLKIFTERWKSLNATSPAPRPMAHARSQLDIDMSDDDEFSTPNTPSPPLVPAPNADKPWLWEFNRYIDGDDRLEHEQGVVAWWGLHSHVLPTWASLARDYLAIMASSVSSERAFSQAGITISKRRNRLKADIVEALQILKSVLNTGLIFREHDATVDWEFENELEEDDNDPAWVDVDADGSDREDDDGMVIDD